MVIDAAGKHISPGIIDCHSHIGHRRRRERVGPDDHGRSAHRRLHRSRTTSTSIASWPAASRRRTSCTARPTRSAARTRCIKFRWGADAEEMKFAAAPPGIKFALGENVKQSNWGERSRHAAIRRRRMGVEQIMRDAFRRGPATIAAAWDAWNATQDGPAAAASIWSSKRWPKSSKASGWSIATRYRQDEILALMRICDDFDVTIGTFQHILEGYKVADAMAKHGVGGSTLLRLVGLQVRGLRRDSLQRRAACTTPGVVVSFNSDDAELARRLEPRSRQGGEVRRRAARGGAQVRHAQPGQAARHRPAASARSKPGKDADLVVWSGSPAVDLSAAASKPGSTAADTSTCQEDRQRRKPRLAKLRAALVQRILASGEPRRRRRRRRRSDRLAARRHVLRSRTITRTRPLRADPTGSETTLHANSTNDTARCDTAGISGSSGGCRASPKSPAQPQDSRSRWSAARSIP